MLSDHDLLQGKTVAVDATTLEANAAMRSIVRRDTGQGYREYLEGLARAEGIPEPTRQEVARLDRKRANKASEIRSYVAEPDRGRRNWKKDAPAREAVYANRRRIRGDRGKRLQRLRAEHVERSFAHTYETGGMRRTHLRGHTNIYKRLCIHGGAFNLRLVMRKPHRKGNAERVEWIGIDFLDFCRSRKRYFGSNFRLLAVVELSFSRPIL